MKKLLTFLLVLTALMACSSNQQPTVSNTNNVAPSNNSSADTTEIKALIKKYAEAVGNADTVLGAKLFAPTGEVSFIHPRGHEHGWEEINSNIYKFFGDTFSKRKLTVSDEKITVYGDTAWAEFYWVFDATFRKDNSPLQTKGRESHVWRKIENGWRLVHVHYSGMPVTGERQGF